MPKLKPSVTEQMNREVRASLMAGQERKALTDPATAKCLGSCKATYQIKKREPERFTLADLRILVRVFKIPDEEILRMVRAE